MSAEVVVTDETRADDGGHKHLLRPHGMDPPDWGAADDLAASLANAGAEIDRLQRRVVELEAQLDASECVEDDEEAAHQDTLRLLKLAQAEAAEQRKRAEEAEGLMVEARLRVLRAEAQWEDKARTLERARAAAIEKARQEERERCAKRLEAAVGADTLCGRNEVLRGMAAELRTLESES